MAQGDAAQGQAKIQITSVSVPIRVQNSHDRNQVGFRSKHTGVLASFQDNKPIHSIRQNSICILGVNIDSLSIGLPNEENYQQLDLVFSKPVMNTVAQDLVADIATGLSTCMARTQRDGWYGNRFVEVDWFNWNDAAAGGGLRITDSLAMRMLSPFTVTPQMLSELAVSPYSEIFVDGMKAEHDKAKYIYWFVLLEELENRKEFRPLFAPLFTDEERDAVTKAAANFEQSKKDRLLGLIRGPRATREKREEKMMRIFHNIGIKQFEIIGSEKIDVTVGLCAALIESRNKLAHKGATVDEGLLHNSLFQLAQKALDYLNANPLP